MQSQSTPVKYKLLLTFPVLQMQFNTQLIKHRCNKVSNEQRPLRATGSTAFPNKNALM